ncbi:MAG: DUF4476 domain-containing protein [Sphingobacteriales bacterium]|nr:MAG: DUF4476 domain-containing protein [Sphingobacteriales bacterium]
MKKYLLTLLLFVLALPEMMAQGYRSVLKLRLSDNSPITVAIDRRHYNQENRVITVGNFPPGRHNIRVFKYSPRLRRDVVVYEGMLSLRPGTMSYMVIDRMSGRARISNTRIGEGGYRAGSDERDSYDWDRNDRYRNYDSRDGRHDDRQDDRDRDTRYNDRNDDRYSDGSSNGRGGQRGRNSYLDEDDMNSLRESVGDRVTDSDKLKQLRTVLQDRSYSMEQVRTMMRWLSFESTRVEFAKWAYDNAQDRQDYWKLADDFSFSSSKDEFNDYLNTMR